MRYTVIQDAGKAVHPTYVEGQYQGGAAQGIGWALNEEYIYGKDGRLQNAGFLDYRIPVCSDLPMIDTQILEIPNPNHPYGVRGVGETSIVPPLAAIANAMSNAFGVRMTHVPMSPPRVLKALEAAQEGLIWPRSTFGGRSVRQRAERPSFSRGQDHPRAVPQAGGRLPRHGAAHRARRGGLDQRQDFPRQLAGTPPRGRRNLSPAAHSGRLIPGAGMPLAMLAFRNPRSDMCEAGAHEGSPT